METHCKQQTSSIAQQLRLMLFLLLATYTTLTANASSRLADQRNVIFDRYSTEDGLSHASVTAITQDKYGFIWIGTQEGLNRFDGYKFETFYHRDDIEGSISNHSINSLLYDTSGALWVGTNEGLNRLDENSKRFEAYILNEKTEGTERRILTLFESKDGVIWIGTDSGLSARYPDGRFRHFRNDEKGIGNVPVRGIFEDASDDLYVSTTRDGLLKYSVNTDRFEKVREISSSNTSFITQASDGDLWIAGTRGGVFIFNTETRELKQLNRRNSNETGLSNHRIRTIFRDRQDELWLGSSGGLFLFNPSNSSFSRYIHDNTDPHSLSDNNVTALFQDAAGVIWVGTYNGLSKFNSETVAFPRFRSGSYPGLTSDSITSFAESTDNNVWVGTFGGLNLWNSEEQKFERFTVGTAGLSDNRVMSLAGKGNQIWIGTMAHGVNLIEGKELSAIMLNDPLDPNSLSSNSISSIHISEGNEIWIGTYGGGVNRYLGAGRFERFPKSENPNGNFTELRTLDVSDGPDGDIWIATDGGGIIVLNPDTGNTTFHRHEKGNPDSLASDKVTSLLFHQQKMWIGTRDSGLNLYIEEEQRFQPYNRILGLSSDLVYGLLPDKEGRIWVSGGKGLSVLDPGTGEVQIFDSTHGLQGDDFNSGAYLKLADGTFLFGGNNGFNAFTPEEIKRNTYIPPIRITEYSKFNRPVPMRTPIYKLDAIELSHEDSVFGFGFAAMDFTAPQKNRFRYRLEGFDRGWTEADTHQVTYTNLDAGTYRFSVQGSNNDGVWNELGTSIEILVHPPIWATWWAYSIYLAVALILVRQALAANQLRLQREAEKRYSERLQLYIESLEEATDTVLIADSNKNLLYANNSIEESLGVSAKYAEGRSIMSLLFNDDIDAEHAREGIKKEGRWHGEVLSHKDGRQNTTDVTITAVRDENENETAFVSIARDITDRKKVEEELEAHRLNLQSLVEERTTALKHEIAENKAAQKELANSLEEKELLLKEVHHRVKNNMQVISSLLNIQAETVDDDIFSGLLGESQQRIKSMSLIHENLYQSENLLEIDFDDYINMLSNSLHRFYRLPEVIVKLDIQVFNVALDIETAVPCGLIINELISNAFKHAFKGRTGEGKISVVFRQTSSDYVLTIRDDGNGLPEGFSLETQNSMGTEIVVILTHQLDGHIDFMNDNGAKFEITFPKKDRVEQLAAGS